jgi:hypothetical protein
MEFRKLKTTEIETRAQSIKDNGAVFLLYKDARADMKILDETVGVENWQRSHNVVNGNLFCTVSIWDSDKEQWISKEDVGTESRTEKEKGQASDSFKRACFNWGIGRELYTSPFIWINLQNKETYKSGSSTRIKSSVNFEVSSIDYDDEGHIKDLEIIDQDGNLRFKQGEYIPAGGKGKKSSSSGKKKKKSSTSTGSEEISQSTATTLKDYVAADDKKAKSIIQAKLQKEGYNGWGGIFKLTEEEGKNLLGKIA